MERVGPLCVTWLPRRKGGVLDAAAEQLLERHVEVDAVGPRLRRPVARARQPRLAGGRGLVALAVVLAARRLVEDVGEARARVRVRVRAMFRVRVRARARFWVLG